MLGPGFSGLLLDSAHPGRLRLHPDLLPRGRRLSGAGCRRQHAPGVEHTVHSEPVRHQVLLAGHQVQSHSCETTSFIPLCHDDSVKLSHLGFQSQNKYGSLFVLQSAFMCFVFLCSLLGTQRKRELCHLEQTTAKSVSTTSSQTSEIRYCVELLVLVKLSCVI